MRSRQESETDIRDAAQRAIKHTFFGADAQKHTPDEWRDEPIEEHLLKGARHALTYLAITGGHQAADGEDHLEQALTRIAMAAAVRRQGQMHRGGRS